MQTFHPRETTSVPQRHLTSGSFTVRAKYADNITYASTAKGEINLTKTTVPVQLNA